MAATLTDPRTQTRPEGETKQPWLWHVVLLNDDDHTFDYVIQLLVDLFGHSQTRALKLAQRVDQEGRAVVFTTHKELAELKRDQVISYGEDRYSASAVGPLSCHIEPAEFGDGDEDPTGESGGSDQGAGKA